MNANQPLPLEDQFSSQLAAWDDALAVGAAPELIREIGDLPELRDRLQRGLACLQRLQRLRPRSRPAGRRDDGVPPSLVAPPKSWNTDQNLLFGVLALQADLIDHSQFIEACTLWAARKHAPLADLLVERGWLTPSDKADVERLLQRKLRKHAGNANASLAAVTDGAVRQALADLEDAAIRDSLMSLPPSDRPGPTETVDYVRERRQRYTLTLLHGKGGLGQVWLAHDGDLGRNVALKELRPDRARHSSVHERFLHEARVTSQLEHPGIVPIYEVARGSAEKNASLTEQHPFYTMRFIKGRTLTEAIHIYHQQRQAGQAGPLELNELLNAFVDVCNAVAYAHSRGVIHRDLKGQNIVLGNFGEVIVLDWGLAKVLRSSASDPLSVVATVGCDEPQPPQQLTPDGEPLTLQGQVVGTPEYMAPEQAAGHLDQLDRRTDVYGLGAILYELLTGEPPFMGADIHEVLRKVGQELPARPRQVCAGVPPALEAVCLRALAKKQAERYASAGELAREVQRWLADEPPEAYQEPLPARLRRWTRRHKPHVAGLAAVLFTAVVALVVSTVLFREERVRNAEEKRGFKERVDVLDMAQKRVETAGYLKYIALADREIADGKVALADREIGKVARADELLELCLPGLRHWEWHYLHRRTHLCVRTFGSLEESVYSVAYSPDGLHLAAGEDGGEMIKIWDLTTGQLIYDLQGGGEGGFSLSYNHDGSELAAASVMSGLKLPDPPVAYIWNMKSGKVAHRLRGSVGNTQYVAYSPDGRHLATASSDKTVKIWDAKTGRLEHDFPLDLPLWAVAYSPNGERLAVSTYSDGILMVLDAVTGEVIHRLPGLSGIFNVRFSPDGRFLASCALAGGPVRIWDPTTGTPTHVLPAHSSDQSVAVFSPDSKLLATSSYDGTFKIWEMPAGRPMRTFRGHNNFVYGVAFSPDSQRLATTSADKTVKIWDIADLERKTGPEALPLADHAAAVKCLAFSSDGQRFATAGADRVVKVWETGTGKLLQTLPGHAGTVLSVAFHPDSWRLVSASEDGTVRVWDAMGQETLIRLRGFAGTVRSVVFSRDGRQLATAGDDRLVRVWDATTGEVVTTLAGHKDIVQCLAFRPDGRQLASTDEGGTLKLWDVPTRQEKRSLRSQARPAGCVTFSPDGRYLAWTGHDRSIRIWDLTARQSPVPHGIEVDVGTVNLKGHLEAITGLAFSPDGRRLVSTGEDKTVRLWELATGEEVIALRGHKPPVTNVAFSPDGHLIASAGSDGTVWVWNGTPVEQ